MSSRGLYAAASAMMMDLLRMDTVANNLANINTHGYKRQQTLHHDFRLGLMERLKTIQPVFGSQEDTVEFREAPPVAIGNLGTGTIVAGSYVNFASGALEETGNPLDLALQGTGFLTVETPNGLMYTRNGALSRNGQGELVTAEGFRVLGENGPILLPEAQISINEAGEIYVDHQYLERLRIVDFAEPWSLIRRGSSFFAAPSNAVEQLPKVRVLQGALERANVDTAQEMVQMITALRAYQMSQKALQSEDEMTGRLIEWGKPV